MNERTRTPLNATFVTMCTAGIMAMLIELETLADLVSIGTLAVFFLVATACVWRRYQPREAQIRPLLLAKVMSVVVLATALSISYSADAPWQLTLTCGILWIVAVTSLCWEPVVFTPRQFTIPLHPFTPCAAILANVFLITSLSPAAFYRFAAWFVLSLVFYVLYGVQHSGEPDGISSDNGAGDSGAVAGDDPFLDDVNFLDSNGFNSALEMARQAPSERTPRKGGKARQGRPLAARTFESSDSRIEDVELSEA